MLITLHKNATTTPVTSRALQQLAAQTGRWPSTQPTIQILDQLLLEIAASAVNRDWIS